jgi:hypothetical protein
MVRDRLKQLLLQAIVGKIRQPATPRCFAFRSLPFLQTISRWHLKSSSSPHGINGF